MEPIDVRRTPLKKRSRRDEYRPNWTRLQWLLRPLPHPFGTAVNRARFGKVASRHCAFAGREVMSFKASHMPRYLIVEDHPLTARATVSFLRDLVARPCVFETAFTIEQAEQLLAAHLYDAVFLDLGLPGCDGIQALASVQRLAPRSRVIVVSGRLTPLIVRQSRSLGACAYIYKGTDEPVLEEAFRKVLNGESVWPRVPDDEPSVPGWLTSLTATERVVLIALSRTQRSTKALAKVLRMHPATVKSHLYRVLKKTGMHNRAELVVAAREAGLLGAPMQPAKAREDLANA